MHGVLIDIRNTNRRWLFRVDVPDHDPPSVVRRPGGGEPEVYLAWDQAFDDGGSLRRCPVCGCRELFARRDFPQVTGFVIVVAAAVASMVLLGFGQVLWALGMLAALVVLDAGIFLFTGRCLVCYRCRSEFRRLPIRKDHPGWDLATGEKYRARQEG